jgi:hypothetical protein
LFREDSWQEFRPPDAALQLLEDRLGPRWFGMDVGEQDGRFIGRLPTLFTEASDRLSGLRFFDDFFEKMAATLGHRLVALVSLSMPHYLLRSGYYSMAGAETAQALINGQVFYAFLRGAGLNSKKCALHVGWLPARFGWGPHNGPRVGGCLLYLYVPVDLSLSRLSRKAVRRPVVRQRVGVFALGVQDVRRRPQKWGCRGHLGSPGE